MFGQFMKMNTASYSGSGTLPGNTITNPKEDLKGITTQRGTAYPRPTIPTTYSSPVVEHETEATKDTVHPTNNGSTEYVQPSVVPTESLIHLKGITSRSGTTYQGPTIPTTSSALPPVVERETEATKDKVHPTNNRSTKDVQPSVVQTESLILNSEPVVAPIIEPVVPPVSALKPNQRPSMPYPSRLHDQ
uniref:Reverse transcriptase domain-containing protein n=1 Tax=Tanacetum cinerariifolium TaxID=118510 RepID=A0A6L2LHK8_TANCI|nr:reverse transcriptase domain-containing protein [Tanacetum cinerariifolium]